MVYEKVNSGAKKILIDISQPTYKVNAEAGYLKDNGYVCTDFTEDSLVFELEIKFE